MIIDNYVRFFKELSLKELRKRQNLVKQQQRIAYRALIALNDKEDSLAEAVFQKEFS